MTNKYNNVYLNTVSTVVGPFEHEGPLSKRFDRYYKDLYMNERTFEITMEFGGTFLNGIVEHKYSGTKRGFECTY